MFPGNFDRFCRPVLWEGYLISWASRAPRRSGILRFRPSPRPLLRRGTRLGPQESPSAACYTASATMRGPSSLFLPLCPALASFVPTHHSCLHILNSDGGKRGAYQNLLHFSPAGTNLERVRAALIRRNINVVVPEEILPGADWAEQIARNIGNVDLVIGVLTAERRSQWVLFELGQAAR